MSEFIKNVPALRFLEFDDKWQVKKLGNVCKFQQGIQVDLELQSRECFSGSIRFLRIENFTQKSQDFRYIPIALAKSKFITKDEIAVVRYGATAGFIGRGFEGVIANNLFKLLPNFEFIKQDYLYHYLKGHKVYSFFQSEMAGGAMPALSFGIVEILKLPLPSTTEQQKIADFLSSVDKKIEQLTEKHRLLTEYKKGVMQQIFTQQIRFKDNQGNDYPEWVEKRLGSLVEIMNGLTYSPDDIVEDGLLVLRSSNIKNGRLVFTDNVFVNVDVKKTAYTQKNDILVCVRNGSKRLIGKNVLVKGSFPTATHGAFMTVLRGESNEFISHWFQMDDYYKQVHQNLGATINSINGSDLKKFKLSIPPSKEEQQKIANFLTEIDQKIEQAWSTLEQTKAFKKGLLQKMFV